MASCRASGRLGVKAQGAAVGGEIELSGELGGGEGWGGGVQGSINDIRC
jgi:hypothetical protein